MKKALTILVSIMLLFTLPISGAGTEGITKQATVYGIPWFSSTDEVVRRLIDNQFIASAESIFIMDKVGLDYILDKQAGLTSVGDYSTVMTAITLVNNFEISDIKMAGYLIDMMEVNFAYDGSQTKLISVVVKLQAPDGYKVSDNMLPDILTKLEKLYGVTTETGEDNRRNYVFFGAEQTAINVQYSSWADTTLTLVYGTLDALPLLEENLEQLRNQQNGVSSDDLSGL